MTTTTRQPSTPTPGTVRRGRRPRSKNTLSSYLMLLPALLLFGVFMFYPLLSALWTSLTDSSGVSPGEFIGLGNYERMMSDPSFWRASLNTLLLALVSVPLTLVLGFGFALLLEKEVWGRGLFRTIILAPVVISGVVVGMAGRWIFDENIGVINSALEGMGLSAVSWQSGGGPAMFTVLLMLTWSRVGLAAIIYLGALQNVDEVLHEAASLDGASWWQRQRYVVIPQVQPTTFFLTVIMVIETFQVFDMVYVMTGGGPGRATELLVTYAYSEGFDARQQGYGTALGVVVFVVVLAATVLWWRAQRESEETL
ncbi:MAG: sugar ABC transporter permease [Ornithinimicrobium sp.]